MCTEKITYQLFTVILLLVSGCTNALYFYETEKVSLTIEARPDSSQPVQGNLGIKQRVALVSPGKGRSGGDALSAISSFNFQIIPESGTIFDPTLIQTAFITGEAASDLNDEQAANAAEAITLESGYIKDDAGEILRNFWKPNGSINNENEKKLKQWMKDNSYDSDNITYFIRSNEYSESRKEAIKFLGLNKINTTSIK